jgi:hypothetical protein
VTASAKTRRQPVTRHRVNWDQLRAEYRGGQGCTLAKIAERHGIPLWKVQERSAAEGWRSDAPRGFSRADVRLRARQLVKASSDQDWSKIRARLVEEFGDHTAIPSTHGLLCMSVSLRLGSTGAAEPAGTNPGPPHIDGLIRRCEAPGCGQLTSDNPCRHCGQHHGVSIDG